MGLFSALIGNAGVVSQEELSREYGKLLTEGEELELGFKLVRDTFIFTSKRLILVDKQGITGSKTEFMSVAYKSISRFSIETAGTFDLDA
ncbi:MAG: helicase, partial [Bacteroidetes bacterium GWB2_41_8]